MPGKLSPNDVISAPAIPADPPRTAGEREMLLSYLDFYRAVLVRKCADLGAEQLRTTVAPSGLSLARLLRHMAWVEDVWFAQVLHGRAPGAEWAGAEWTTQPDWEMDTADGLSPGELGRQFDEAVAHSREALDSVGLDHLAADPGRHGATSLRWIVVHMIEEYARHCGHADIIRESVDGRVGD